MRHTFEKKYGKEGIATAWLVVFALALVLFIGLVVDTV